MEDAPQRGFAGGIVVGGTDHNGPEFPFQGQEGFGLEGGADIIPKGFADLIGIGGLRKLGEDFGTSAGRFVEGPGESIAVERDARDKGGGGQAAS